MESKSVAGGRLPDAFDAGRHLQDVPLGEFVVGPGASEEAISGIGQPTPASLALMPPGPNARGRSHSGGLAFSANPLASEDFEVWEERGDHVAELPQEPVVQRPLSPLSLPASSPERRLSGGSQFSEISIAGESLEEAVERLSIREQMTVIEGLVDRFCDPATNKEHIAPYRDATNSINAMGESGGLPGVIKRELARQKARLDEAAGITPAPRNWRIGMRGDISGQGSGSHTPTPRRGAVSLRAPQSPEPRSPLALPKRDHVAPEWKEQARVSAEKDDKFAFSGPKFEDAWRSKDATYAAFELFCEKQMAVDNLGFLEKTEQYFKLANKFDRDAAAAVLEKIITQSRADKDPKPASGQARESKFGFAFAEASAPEVTRDDPVNLSGPNVIALWDANRSGKPLSQDMRRAVKTAEDEIIGLLQRDRWQGFLKTAEYAALAK